METIRGYEVSPAVSSQLAWALAAVQSKYKKRYTQAKVNKRFKGQYVHLGIRGTPENTDTVWVIVLFSTLSMYSFQIS